MADLQRNCQNAEPREHCIDSDLCRQNGCIRLRAKQLWPDESQLEPTKNVTE